MPEIIHNKRSAAQWEIISQRVSFNGKTVLDAGCGYCDILVRCYKAGATVTGIERDAAIVQEIRRRYPDLDIRQGAIEDARPGQYDVIICFSVLPYLDGPIATLQWMRANSQQALIECQYSGDGPGFASLVDDNDMRRWLKRVGWQQVEAIGQTLVKGRNKYRTIWLCE